MSIAGWIFTAVLVVLAIFIARAIRKMGPSQVDESVIANGKTLLDVTHDTTAETWNHLGSMTESRGLNLKFEADDDPKASATLLVPGRVPANKGRGSNRIKVTLTDQYQSHHVHTRGYVFQVSIRGSDSVVGKQIIIKMVVESDGQPYGGIIENDDDIVAAIGDWIEIERLQLIQLQASQS